MNRGWGYSSARPPTPNTTEAPLGLAPGSTVTVFSSGTTNPVLLYADRLGMTPLKSSNLQAAEYDGPSRTLTIQFVDGNTYSYTGVPEATAVGLFGADSPGSYFHRAIKGVFPHEQV